MSWQLQEAKQRFSELVRRALTDGPQVVSRRGEDVVVVVSAQEYDRDRDEGPSLVDFLLTGPDIGALDLDRPWRRPRDVELGE